MAGEMNPFIPSGGDPWNRAKAAKLMRRAGFGMTPAELDGLVGDGSALAFNAAVDALVDYPDADAALDAQIAAFDGGVFNTLPDPTRLAVLWLYRMRHANHPLQEQLALFYHDHFATEFQKIRDACGGAVGDDAAQLAKATDIMRTQIEIFRTEGIKDFRALLLAVARDPAMLIYLDNWQNIAGRPQENLARELMELFSMGVNNYTEDDVREVARALTGESLDDAATLGYLYRNEVHDFAPKTVLGTAIPSPPPGMGHLDTEAVIDIILAQDATAEFMAGKFLAWFVTPEPTDSAVEELAQRMRDVSYDFREVLRTLFKSAYFHQQTPEFEIYKTPIDFSIHFIRQLDLSDVQLPTINHWGYVAGVIRQLGMTLFAPPNVGGWIHGKAWINSVNLIHRFNLAAVGSDPTVMTDALVDGYFAAPLAATNSDILNELRERLVQGALRPEEQTALLAHFALIDGFGAPADVEYRAKVRALAHLLCATPLYQLK